MEGSVLFGLNVFDDGIPEFQELGVQEAVARPVEFTGHSGPASQSFGLSVDDHCAATGGWVGEGEDPGQSTVNSYS